VDGDLRVAADEARDGDDLEVEDQACLGLGWGLGLGIGFGFGFGIGFGFGSRMRPSAVKPEEKRLANSIITIEETPCCLKTFDCQLDVNESAPGYKVRARARVGVRLRLRLRVGVGVRVGVAPM
jgi:hypothetical protein